jgi:hypothetical protein
MKITLRNSILALGLSTLLTACGGGGSSSGGGQATSGFLQRCATPVGTVVTNNCTFNVNIRYFTSDPFAQGTPTEAILELAPGQAFDVGPFDGENVSGVPACQAPFRPSQLFQATNITCEN